MKIGLIGGLTRSENFLSKVAVQHGHELEFHTGMVSGHGVRDLRRLVKRSDLIIILTGINSHQAMWLTKQAVREFMRPSLAMRTCGPNALREILEKIALNQGYNQNVPASLCEAFNRI